MANSTTRARFPVAESNHGERSASALFLHSALQAKRLLRRAVRDPLTMIQSVVYPALSLVMFDIVLGRSVTQATGQDSIFGYVPMIVLVGAVFGSLAGGVALKREASDGLLTRFYVLPTHRASGLVGRLVFETVRMILTTLFIVAIGYALGFRFQQGLLPAIAFVAVPLMLGVAFATFVTALAVLAPRLPLVELMSLVCTLLLFFNSGFVPTRAYPTWLQGFVGNQPMSTAIDTMKGLSSGGPVQGPLTATIFWSAVLFVGFAIPAVFGYRRAAAGNN